MSAASIYEAADIAAKLASASEMQAWKAASLAETAGLRELADIGRSAATAASTAADLTRKLAESTKTAYSPSSQKSAPAASGSLPSGESDPSVTTDYAGADTTSRSCFDCGKREPCDDECPNASTVSAHPQTPRRNEMGSKNEPGQFDCYANALPDEPMFILLARDPSAPSLIEWWADNRESAIDQKLRPEGDRSMVAEARQCAKNMRAWRQANDGVWRSPQERTDG